MESNEGKAFIKLWSIVLASLCYCYFIVSKLPIGKFRFFSLLPIFTLFTILPLSLSSALPTGITVSVITWLTNFKLLLFSFNQGPLSNNHPNLSLFHFLLLATLPIRIKNPSHIKKPFKLYFLNLWYVKTLLLFSFVAICHVYNHMLHPFLAILIHGGVLFLLIDVILDICNMLVGSVMGVDLCQPSDEPYLSTSLQDFWGYRWNLVVTDALRYTVYKPVRAFLSKHIGQRWASSPAVLAAFLVSGLMHELTFYYMTRVSPTWEVTWFFVLHGLCVVAEVGLKNALGRKLGLHWAVSGPLTFGFVAGTAYWWFFPPIVRNGVDVRISEEVMSLMTVYEFILGSFR